MEKNTLNKEIILCRAAVGKARVSIVRKLIKKIKILKSCKKERLKEKNIRKSERLFKRLQIIKSSKDDDVTRFALRNTDLEKFIKGSKIDMRQKALACLAKHDAVLKKVNAIKEKIPNWETELPLLLNSMGKKKKKLKELGEKKEKKEEGSRPEGKLYNVPKQKKAEQKTNKNQKKTAKQKEGEIFEKNELKKINDPFFMGKMVIAPKLSDSSKELIHKKVEMEKDRFNKGIGNAVFNAKPFKAKKDSSHKIQNHLLEPEEKLHPSWAAKKVKLFKPFEGKKIKFTDE